MQARLVISTEEGVAVELRVRDQREAGPAGQVVTIGRADGNIVRAPDRTVSRRHAEIRALSGGGFEVVDAGSSYGTLLNGRPVGPAGEALAHKDRVQCGGILVQYLEEDDASLGEGEDDTMQLHTDTLTLQVAEEATELRQQVGRLIDENAGLRRELGRWQDAERAARARHQEAHDEAARLREVAVGLRKEMDELRTRLDALGHELRNERSARAAAPPPPPAEDPRLGEAQRQVERQRQRIVELEEQAGQRVLEAQRLTAEVDRLNELHKKRDKREAELTQVVKPALQRVAQLQGELEDARHALAQAELELSELRQGVRR